MLSVTVGGELTPAAGDDRSLTGDAGAVVGGPERGGGREDGARPHGAPLDGHRRRALSSRTRPTACWWPRRPGRRPTTCRPAAPCWRRACGPWWSPRWPPTCSSTAASSSSPTRWSRSRCGAAGPAVLVVDGRERGASRPGADRDVPGGRRPARLVSLGRPGLPRSSGPRSPPGRAVGVEGGRRAERAAGAGPRGDRGLTLDLGRA